MIRRSHAIVALAALAASALSGCGGDTKPAADGTAPKATEIRLVTHDSFAASKEVLAAFTARTGITIRVVASGDAGAALNQAILTKSHPLGDVFFGVDNTFLSRALKEDLFLPYRPAGLAKVDPRYDLDATEHRVTPVDHGEVCINYDKSWFASHKLAVPTTLDQLALPQYRGLLVVENPATSSPGLAFLLATVARFGEDPGSGWQSFWTKLRRNDVLVTPGWEQAYSGQFSGSSGKGPRPLVVSYASSPPAEIVFAPDPKPTEPPTAVMEDSCFRQIELAGVLRGTKHVEEAKKVVDFFLSPEFQADLPLQMYVYPVRTGTPLPDVFTRFAAQPARPAELPVDRIGAGREQWIASWTATVLG
jgi:thiamine transport system substrate-binding protein